MPHLAWRLDTQKPPRMDFHGTSSFLKSLSQRHSLEPNARHQISIGIEDEEWVSRIRLGDTEAFEVLFQRHYAELCSFATTYVGSFEDAREVAQTVFIKLWENREHWYIDTSVRSYLFAAVRNQGINLRRGEARRRRASVASSERSRTVFERTPEDDLCLREEVTAVQEAIDQLPERQRSAFLLHRRHDLSYREIATMMGISIRTVEVHIARALKALYISFRD